MSDSHQIHPGDARPARAEPILVNDQQELGVRRWSTADVAPPDALEYYAAAARDALLPNSVECSSREDFHAAIEMSSFGPLELIRLFGSAHSVMRADAEIARSERRMFHLVVNRLSPWRLVQLGRLQLRPGDAVLMDSSLPHELTVGTYELVNIRMPVEFVNLWVPDATMLRSRKLDRNGRWTASLAAFASQLTPEFATGKCPLPTEVMTQQLGVLLMLAAGGLTSSRKKGTATEAALKDRIVEEICERLSEVGLTASSVASSMNLSVRTVHLALAAHGQTFAGLLTRLRLRSVEHLRASPAGQKMAFEELAQSTGFKDAGCLARTLRNRVELQ